MLQARIVTQDEVVIVHLFGRVDIESADSFRAACFKHLKDKKIVFSFKDLSFVGSSGIIPFLEAIYLFAQQNNEGTLFCGAGIEFKRILMATPLKDLQIYENESLAISAFHTSGLEGLGIRRVTNDIPFVIVEDTVVKQGDESREAASESSEVLANSAGQPAALEVVVGTAIEGKPLI